MQPDLKVYDFNNFKTILDDNNINYSIGSKKYPKDIFIPNGKTTPHLHLGTSNFFGVKYKEGSMTRLCDDSFNIKITTIETEIDVLKTEKSTLPLAETLKVFARYVKNK